MATSDNIAYLNSLPLPTVLEEVSYESLRQENLQLFLALNPSYASIEESDPCMKLLEAFTLLQVLLISRQNEKLRSRFITLATGTDLDNLAVEYDVTRLIIQAEDLLADPVKVEIKESDDDLRSRIFDRIKGWANAGGIEHYRYWAKTASGDVKDAAISSPVAGLVEIGIISRVNGGVPTQALLDLVTATVNKDTVKVFTDTVSVVAAQKITVYCKARIVLQTAASETIRTNMPTTFNTAVLANALLGWDVTQSWVIGTLQQFGVYKVELLALNTVSAVNTTIGDVSIASKQFADIVLEIIDGGRHD